MKSSADQKPAPTVPTVKRELGREIWKHRSLYVMIFLPIVYFVLLKYYPLWNAQIAFKDFNPIDGVWGSPWIGFENFMSFFNSFYFAELIRNTIYLSLAKLIVGVPLAVILAIALVETRFVFFRKMVQTITYIPHFLSWIIMLGVLLLLLSPAEGLINEVVKAFGGDAYPYMTSPEVFPAVLILSDVWKEMGWSAIIFLAALMAIDPSLYEAAEVEGASRLQRIRYITLPGITDVIIIVVLLRLGNVLDAGFHQIFVLYSLPVYSVSDIIDTWVYRQGILEFQFSLATAVGLFKGAFGMLLLLVSNRLARKVSGSSLY